MQIFLLIAFKLKHYPTPRTSNPPLTPFCHTVYLLLYIVCIWFILFLFHSSALEYRLFLAGQIADYLSHSCFLMCLEWCLSYSRCSINPWISEWIQIINKNTCGGEVGKMAELHNLFASTALIQWKIANSLFCSILILASV